MQYRCLFRPATTRAQKYPIVLWLHGAAGRGSDNYSQLAGGNFAGSHRLDDGGKSGEISRVRAGAAGGCDQGLGASAHAIRRRWPSGWRWKFWTRSSRSTASIARASTWPGQSMGGEGVWAALSIAPTRFAAAIAMCGYGDAYMIPRVAKVPVWIFQGEEDPVVPVSRARTWVAELRGAGGAPKYTEYPSIGHNAWDVAFKEPELVEWLFSNVRVESGAARPGF